MHVIGGLVSASQRCTGKEGRPQSGTPFHTGCIQWVCALHRYLGDRESEAPDNPPVCAVVTVRVQIQPHMHQHPQPSGGSSQTRTPLICTVSFYVSSVRRRREQQRSSPLGVRRGPQYRGSSVPAVHTKAQIHACISIVCSS